MELEAATLEAILPSYEKKGYEHIRFDEIKSPPKAFQNYKPDYILQRAGKYLALEIKKRRIPAVEKNLLSLKQEIESHENWSFEIVYSDEVVHSPGPSVQAENTIYEVLKEAKRQFASGNQKSSFLLSWAAFEAASRRLHSKIFRRPQTPGRLVTVLAERGHILPSEANELRTLTRKRNALIHGELDVEIENEDIKLLLDTIVKLLKSKD